VSEPVRAFIQARMSSRRFPGKVLAPFRGEPLIHSVIRAVEHALPNIPIVLATSLHPSDDPLAAYVATLEIPVFRGPLERVFDRFLGCAKAYPCRWILRVNADSPLLGPSPLQAVVAHVNTPGLDLVTTTFPRTFPRGQNAELIRVGAMRTIALDAMTPDDQEHVTQFFYRNTGRFRVLNVESGDPSLAAQSFAVDTLDDLHRLEAADPVVGAARR
jgi:spore coat polysaccharide biosynthesis protein SpsF (cytidylyltransferase family)